MRGINRKFFLQGSLPRRQVGIYKKGIKISFLPSAGKFPTRSIKPIECLIRLSERDPIRGPGTLASQVFHGRLTDL